ncbi:hypothetical protein L798_07109 [Zootermopsis nevadensis]|uniref:DUF4817 domain-containing protein n=1 Tax=Zootermopsis nevadensis TaxID=136037 RepID=A0A067RJN7_ZOONE|nr:hypothetical protein L798_07109 [Zootermopsis nevadensis]
MDNSLHVLRDQGSVCRTAESIDCVVCKSIIPVHREFRREYGVRPPDDKSIRKWHEQFRETGSVEKRHSTGWPRRYDEDVNSVRQAFMRSLTKSISQANNG